MSRRRASQRRRERAVLLGVFAASERDAEARIGELRGLVESAGAAVVGTVTQHSHGPGRRPGPGKLSEAGRICAELKADLVVAAHPMSPADTRALEEALPCRVVDRTTLILDVFAQRARSSEGKLQVELAQLMYLLPRLIGRGTEMSRITGRGGQAAGGTRGVGTRGPGEQELEYDRRRIRLRVTRLKREIEALRRRRASQRGSRHDREVPLVTMAGYTNAGKTTLFNGLCGAKAVARNQMFSTLDPLTRRVSLPGGGTALLSDTVGFITDMPEDLRVAFRATLEEITDSDLILHVVDASHPESEARMRTVVSELESMGPPGAPVLTVFNKADVLGERRAEVAFGAAAYPPSVLVSALAGDGIGALLATISECLRAGYWRRHSWANPSPRLVAAARGMGVPVTISKDADGNAVEMEAWVTDAQAARLDPVARGGPR